MCQRGPQAIAELTGNHKSEAFVLKVFGGMQSVEY